MLFTSGIQHFAEIPQGMAKAPPYVRDFLKRVPVVWDDVKFIDGFPGAVRGDGAARGQDLVRGRHQCRPAAAQGEDRPEVVRRDKQGTLITDGIDFLGFKSETFPLEKGVTSDEITMRPRGGFVLTLE